MAVRIDLLDALARQKSLTAFAFAEWRGDAAHIEDWSGRELAERTAFAASIIGEIGAPGDRVIIAAGPGKGFVAAFFGCLAAHRIAVPAKAPTGASSWLDLVRLAADCGAAAIIVREQAALDGATNAILIPVERLLAGKAAPHWTSPPDDCIAYLQYTSGSTRAPRGVIVTFAALHDNIAAMRACWRLSADDIGAYWLPPHHDMGLVGGLLAPVALGFPSVLMHPSAFLQRPHRWAHLIAARRATFSGGPNFAFDLLAAGADRLPRDTDLRCWRVAVNGAEPVRRRTLANAAAALAPFGFDPDALCPGYGLAESVLFVTARAPGDAPATPPALDAQPVDCGAPTGETKIAIVDPQTHHRTPEGSVGEIWVHAARPAGPYWNRPADSTAVFGAQIDGETGSWLRTGDLGRLDGAALVVCGRLKDILVRRGRKAQASDLEAAIREALALPAALRAAVFAAGDAATGERIIAAVETLERRPQALPLIAAAIGEALAAADFAPDVVLLVRPSALPLTSSGKLAKGAIRAAFEADALAPLLIVEAPASDAPALSAPEPRRHYA